MQNFPSSDAEAVRSGRVEVTGHCSPTIFNCKLTSLSTGKFTIIITDEQSCLIL